MNLKNFFKKTRINIDLRPKMTWSIKGLCGTLCAGLSCTSLYSGYKKDYRGSTFSGIGAALSLLAYYMLDNKESKAIEKKYKHEEKMARIKHPSNNDQPQDKPILSPSANDQSQDKPIMSLSASPIIHIGETLNKTCNKSHDDFNSMRLVGDLVFKGDSIIIFSSDGEGKSTLAMNFCIDIASGSATSILPKKEISNSPLAQTVYYYDAELDDADIQMRYGKYGYTFPDSLRRIPGIFNSVEDLFNDIKERVSIATTDITICVDNLSAIFPSTSAKMAQDYFRRQMEIKDIAKSREHSVTFITVTHSTKTTRGKVNETFYGSSYIGNLAATRIGLFPTRFGEEYKMLKVQKNRKFGKDGNVIIIKREQNPYLHFEYDRTIPEAEADAHPISIKKQNLPATNTPNRKGRKTAPHQSIFPADIIKIKEMHDDGVAINIIAKKFNVCNKTIERHIKKIKAGEQKKAV